MNIISINIGQTPRVLAMGLLTLLSTGCDSPRSSPQSVPVESRVIVQSSKTPPDADGARAFLAELYSHYRSGEERFTPLLDNAPSYFDTPMIELMTEDRRLTLSGEMGAIDSDPVCECQDLNHVMAEISIEKLDPASATASVRISDEGAPDVFRHQMTVDLVYTARGWRIHDITATNAPSLRARYQEANESRRRGRPL